MRKQTYNPDIHRRHSIRLSTHDYKAKNAYFVTICSNDTNGPIFAVPALRTLLTDTWQALPQRFPGVALDAFVIMPDHIHFIIWLDHTQSHAPTLGRVVGAYKSLVSVAWLNHIKKHALIEYSGSIWQRDYYERVIRIGELDATRAYIRNNPGKQQGPKHDEM